MYAGAAHCSVVDVCRGVCVGVSGMYAGDAYSDCVDGSSGDMGWLVGDAGVVACCCCCGEVKAEASSQ